MRLAGLYALERLGKANPEHRQTIVDVLCAYLRMPLNTNDNDGPAFEEERQVRKTAQRSSWRTCAGTMRPTSGSTCGSIWTGRP